MDSDFRQETNTRKSSVVSSEASSQISLSSGCDYESEVINKAFVLRHKSSSLSCLPDHIPDFDFTSLTLPPNLNSVKPFGENLLREGASSARSCYETAECLEQHPEELKDSSNEDQRSALELNNSEVDGLEESNNVINGMEPKEKRAVDISEFNTETQTFVRSSALDILAKFPKTETVSTTEGGDTNLVLNVVKEDAMEGKDQCTDGAQICSKSAGQPSNTTQSEQNNVTSWSSTSDIKDKRGKKGLFNNKKVKDISNITPESNSAEKSDNQSHVKAKKAKKHVKKDTAKSSQSSAWLNIFRGKNTVADERPKELKATKQRKPLQKSQSFNTSPLPRNSQLNRMDSFRKLFKRPRDSAGSPQSEPIDNVKCVEISSPILKSNFKSKNLVDREVFLRERAYQMDKTKVKKEKTEREEGVVSNVKANNNSNLNKTTTNEKNCDNIGNGRKDETNMIANGSVNSQEIPIAPVRHKHLQRKQRLSMQGSDGLLCDSYSEDNDSNKESEEGKSDSNETEEFQDESEVANCNESNPECKVEIKDKNDEEHDHDSSLANKTVSPNENISHNEKTSDYFNVDPSQVAESAVNDEVETVVPEYNANLDYIVVGTVPNDSEVPVTSDTSYLGVGSPVSILSSPGSMRGQSESEFEDVFVDCVSDETISVDSATLLVDKPQVDSEDTADISMPAGRWKSDVTSERSQHAIRKVVPKKADSFSGVTQMSSRDSRGNSMVISPTGVRSPILQSRRVSTFRVPSFRFEPSSEPISLITDVVPVTFPHFLTDRRSQIVLELFTTERTYVRGLETMIELFKMPMLAGKMDESDVDAVFSNLNDIFNINKDLLFLLWEKVKHWNTEQCIAHIFIEMEERFKIYATYCKNFDNADSMLKQKIKKNKEFDRFLKACYQDPLCQPGLDLPAYLITIVQRIPRYLLLLKDLYKKTPSSHPDYNSLQTALSRMNKVAEHINSQLQEVHGKKAMQELRSTVIGLKAYEVKGRTLLKEGEVCLMSPKKPYKCLLFNDIMVFAVQGSKDRSEIEMTLELRTLWFEDLKKQDPQTNKCDAIELYTPHRPYTLYACSRTDKRIWLQKLRTAIVTLLYGTDCEDPDGMDISKRKASDTYFDGSVYCGEYVNGKRHGQGVMAWPNRTRYEGSWANDERHGQGQLTYYTGEKYVGNWVADKKEGMGRQTYVNNDVYTGQWKEGMMHGEGEILFANGDRYVGEMFNNEVEGIGELTCCSRLIYKGEWKKSKRHGRGHLFLPNGNEYKGEMLNDRICGSGTMNYFNGDEYIGEWVNELRHGSGCFKLVNGTVYDGQWNKDCMNGEGEMKYSNGDVYTGTWYQNKRVGRGQLMYVHGDTYNGQWQADTMHGKGVMYYKDGSVYEGEWEQGQPCGHGKTTYKDKRVYEGEYWNGFRHGRGQLIYPNNILYVGEWKCDKFDGNGVFNDPNTDYSYTGDWSCGMREGSGVEISYRTRYEGKWKADMKHGEGEEKSHAGHVFVGTWKENRKHGKGTRTLRSKVEETQHWHEGHLIDGGDTVAEELPPLPRR